MYRILFNTQKSSKSLTTFMPSFTEFKSKVNVAETLFTFFFSWTQPTIFCVRSLYKIQNQQLLVKMLLCNKVLHISFNTYFFCTVYTYEKHGKYVVNVATRYDQIFYFPNLVMTRFSHVGGWQVCLRVLYCDFVSFRVPRHCTLVNSHSRALFFCLFSFVLFDFQ